MKRIGLTGNIGTGKSTVARIFEILGVPVYHADKQAHKILNSETVTVQVASLFGEKVLNKFNGVDRKALATLVFNDKEKLNTLNNLIHPLVEADFLQWCDSQADQEFIIQEAAILFESGFDRLFDATILVTASHEVCLKRVMVRDGITEQMVEQRMNNQWPQEKKMEIADYLVNNDGILMVLPQVLAIHQKIIES
jgi:dephospho-CoA kinase